MSRYRSHFNTRCKWGVVCPNERICRVSPYFHLQLLYSFIISLKYFAPVMRKQRGMICHVWQQAGCKMVQLLVVLSITAVLVVHKLLSCLPYRATPSAAQTSCGAPLVSLLYTSKRSAEHITTRREREIIAGQTSPAPLCFVCWYLRLNPPCC